MNSNYLHLPIGNISKDKLRPWLEWLGNQKFGEFSSFVVLAAFFADGVISNANPQNICEYRKGSYEEADEFIKKEILFLVNMDIFEVGEDASAHVVVRFFLDGTVEVDEIYLDDSMLTKSIEENIKNINLTIEQRQKASKLSWKDFVKLHEEIMRGEYGREHVIPEF